MAVGAKKKKISFTPFCLIFFGFIGLFISFFGFPTITLPSSFHSSPWMPYIAWFTSGTCPATIQSARISFSKSNLGSYLFSSFSFLLNDISNQNKLDTTIKEENVKNIIKIDPISGLKIYTIDELARHDGKDELLSPPLLLAVWGDVFDVSVLGKDFYSPGMSYACFGGKDGTRALTLGSLDTVDVNSLDVSDFDANFFNMMIEQHAFYVKKYPRVGMLIGGTKDNYKGPHKFIPRTSETTTPQVDPQATETTTPQVAPQATSSEVSPSSEQVPEI